MNGKLLREWLCDSILQHDYFSCQSVGADGKNELRAFQLLSHPRHLITVRTFDTDAARNRSLFNIVPLELWHHDMVQLDAREVSILAVSEPQEMDLIHFLGGDPDARSSVSIWKRGESDIDGCFLLCDRRAATPHSPLTSSRYPLLALHDTIDAHGHIAVDRICDHTARSGLYYVKSRKHLKSYLQCVLSAKWLFAHGQDTFRSRRPNAYYTCILKRPGSPPRKQKRTANELPFSCCPQPLLQYIHCGITYVR